MERIDNPIEGVKEWLAEASKLEKDANAMSVASVDAYGSPTSRIVLLKSIDKGFVFYTNLGSRKACDIKLNPKVSLCFHWKSTTRQVRVQGVAQLVTGEEADSYFVSRERESQLAAWASEQSKPIEDRQSLLDKLALYREEFDGKLVPRPGFWSGFRVLPSVIEFWDKKPSRLHERIVFTLSADGGWTSEFLNP